jgi:protein-L-isoaspartate(D-aspartate) O-methyltransferase
MAGSLGFLGVACAVDDRTDQTEEGQWASERRDMVSVLRRYGVRDEKILAAMEKVRRHVFIPPEFRRHNIAYGDHPCQIGHGQTISQPFIVAYMTDKLALGPGEKLLEIGTGSGYQAAVLAELGVRVFSIEIVPELADHARAVLAQEGYTNNVQVLTGDGYKGWPEKAPFDAVMVTCAPDEIPKTLVEQLKEGGRMILPVGGWMGQRLVILKKRGGKVEQTDDLPVRFVPMVKEAGR